MDEIIYKIAIGLLPGIGPVKGRKLISYVGSVEGVFSEKTDTLKKIPGIGDILSSQVKLEKVLDTAKKEAEFINRNKIKSFFYLDDNYPDTLKKFDDSPLSLYIKGEIDFKNKKFLSIVGTRKISNYGYELCSNLIKDLSDKGFTPIIVSGLAYGVDYCAHKSALQNNLKTIAVLGHGLDYIYPATHRQIASQIINNGALLTEFTSYNKRDPANFIRRNRIIAALSEATVVVETPKKGGSLTTAEYAVRYSKDVYAFPGKIGDNNSAGCNFLIKTNRAGLIEDANDLIYNLSWENSTKIKQKEIFVVLSDEEQKIVNILKDKEYINVDNIVYETRMPINRVLAILFNLEFKDVIKSLPGRMYKLI